MHPEQQIALNQPKVLCNNSFKKKKKKRFAATNLQKPIQNLKIFTVSM